MGSTIISEATLSTMPAGWWPTNASSLNTFVNYNLDYEAMYRTHNNVRVCVDFLARNIAHLGLHIYQRDTDDNRVRLRDHAAVNILHRPMPADNKITQYKLLEAVLSDMFISGNGYILKVRANGQVVGLLRIPYTMISVYGKLVPNKYVLDFGTGPKELAPSEIIHIRTYNSSNNIVGISPLEGLREILAEEYENTKYSARFWENSARIGGVIERPATTANWSDTARARFRSEWESMYSGEANSGKTAVLEEGMTFKPMSVVPKDTQYLEARKLSREECARAFHIPPPMVGILEHSTFSNITEQHKSLYNDVLGPLCASFEDDFDIQYLSEFPDLKGAYSEFNIEEKLQGDFEAQANSLRQAVGVPYMTANEARARMNLPRLDSPDADQLVTPLNMLAQSTGEPNDGKSRPDTELKHEEKIMTFRADYPEIREKYQNEWQKLLTKTFTRQMDTVMPKVKGAKSDINLVWDRERWNQEVFADFYRLTKMTATAFALAFAGDLAFNFDPEQMDNYLQINARIAAENLNQATMDEVNDALMDPNPLDALKKVFEIALAVKVFRFATGRITSLQNFSIMDVAQTSGYIKTKTWVVNSDNPRDTHLRLDGETVGIRDRFSNGALYPGDFSAGAAEVANCKCSLIYGRKR